MDNFDVFHSIKLCVGSGVFVVSNMMAICAIIVSNKKEYI